MELGKILSKSTTDMEYLKHIRVEVDLVLVHGFFYILFSTGLLIHRTVIRLMWIPQFVSPNNFNLSPQTLVAKASPSEVQMLLLHSASL